PHWYEKNISGSGPFKFVSYEAGTAIKGVRNPDYYHEGLPYLDGFSAVYAPKQAVRVDAMRSDRAAIDFRNLPPAARDELVGALGDKIAVQESDLNCGNLVTPNQKRKPFDDVRVRRALTLAIDRWNGELAQPFKYLGTWLVDEWRKVGLTVHQRIVPVGPWFEAMRSGNFDVTLEGNCQSVINPVIDIQKYLPRSVFTENYGNFEDQGEVDLYQKMLHETDPVQQRALLRAFEKHVDRKSVL